MSCDKFKPHLHIYAEDAATRDTAGGFAQSFPTRRQRQMQTFTCPGYPGVREKVEHDAKLADYPERRILCVIDFDNHPDRFNELKRCVSETARARVYVVGCAGEIETAKRMLNVQGHDDDFGKRLARLDNNDWDAPCLRASKPELQRLLDDLRSNGICP